MDDRRGRPFTWPDGLILAGSVALALAAAFGASDRYVLRVGATFVA